MAAKKNETKAVVVETIAVPVVRGEGGKVDLEAFLLKAEETITAFEVADTKGLEKVGTVIEGILANDRYAKMPRFSPSDLAKLALGILGEFPSDKAEAAMIPQVKAYLNGKGDEVFYVGAGRNAGYHIKARYTAADFAKLTKTDTTEAE